MFITILLIIIALVLLYGGYLIIDQIHYLQKSFKLELTDDKKEEILDKMDKHKHTITLIGLLFLFNLIGLMFVL